MDAERVLVAALLFRATALIAGVGVIAYGYKLFLLRATTSAGNFEASYKDFRLAVGPAVPGSVIAIIGGLIALAAVIKPVGVEQDGTSSRITALELPPDSMIGSWSATMARDSTPGGFGYRIPGLVCPCDSLRSIRSITTRERDSVLRRPD